MKDKFALITITCVLVFWTIYTRFFASQEILRAFEDYSLDALMHFLGGVWLMGILGWLFNWSLSRHILALVIAVFVWESLELIIFPDVRHLYFSLFPYWLKDTIADIAVGTLGGAVYLVVEKFRLRPPQV